MFLNFLEVEKESKQVVDRILKSLIKPSGFYKLIMELSHQGSEALVWLVLGFCDTVEISATDK